VTLAAAIMMLLPATAWAERAIDAEVDATAPFDAPALTSALRARLPDGDAVQLRVFTTFDGVRIETRGTTRDVALRGLAGDAAARLVALATADLLVDAVDLEPPPLMVARRPPTIGVLGTAAAWGQTFGGLGLDVALPRGSYLITIEAGAGTLVDGPIRLTAGMLRAGLGVRRGLFEARLTALAAPMMVSNGDGDATILGGGGASGRIRLPLGSGLHAILAAGVDAFATRTTYVVDGMTALTTPRIAPWGAIGLEVAP
jgi:hypothetical protein